MSSGTWVPTLLDKVHTTAPAGDMAHFLALLASQGLAEIAARPKRHPEESERLVSIQAGGP